MSDIIRPIDAVLMKISLVVWKQLLLFFLLFIYNIQSIYAENLIYNDQIFKMSVPVNKLY